MYRRNYIESQYKPINIKYLNDKGKVVGYETIKVKKDLTTIIQQLNWQVKQWNRRNSFELEAVKAEQVFDVPTLKHKIKVTQLTVFDVE